jgi:hypothetical protein
MNFDAFVGIDWSGAKGRRHRGIQVAISRPGRSAPQIVPPPQGVWSRQAVFDWCVDILRCERALVGFDFSFTLPFVDRGAYFPGVRETPRDAATLWSLVDRVAAQATDYYGGPFVQEAPFEAHFRKPGREGALFARRHKVVEQACREQGLGAPESVFHLIGPKQVGLGSLAGMRFLSALRREMPKVRIWPFDDVQPGASAVVEVFPRVFLAAVGHSQGKVRSAEALTTILHALGSAPMVIPNPVDDNVADAAVTAAGLRAWSGAPDLWRPPAMGATVRRTEGWIFGVR